MTSEEMKELKGLAASMGLYDDRKPCKRAVILGKAIKALEQTGWISVSDRLPEDGRPVLIYAWNVHHVIARYDEFRTANGYKKTWVTADAWNGNTEINHEVIAWMPLPAPFEPQERSGEV